MTRKFIFKWLSMQPSPRSKMISRVWVQVSIWLKFFEETVEGSTELLIKIGL